MRFYLLIIFCFMAMGCNSDPACRRETALLRSEILDLEDKYYLLKSERDALAQGHGCFEDQSYDSQPVYENQPTYDQPIYDSQPYNSQPIYEGSIPIAPQLLGNETYDQPYDENIGYVDGQAYFTDTGEPYYGETAAYGTGYGTASADPDIIYENEVGYEAQVLSNDYGDNYSNDYSSAAQQLNQQPTLARSESRLAPDDSILPLYSGELGGAAESDSYSEDFDLDPELESQANNEELNLLLESPSDIEVGFDSKPPTQEITEVVINRLATQGHDIDGVPGDEGLDLLIQPRSADGQVHLVAGELTVSVIDPAQSTDKQRIGLWKFVESETELFFANNELGSYGILLHLPWDQETPVNKKLMVNVRFIPTGGERLETVTEIRIDPPQSNYSPDDPLVTGWTRSDSRWNTELGSFDNQGSSVSRTRSNGSVSSDWTRRGSETPVRRQIAAPAQTKRTKIRALPAKATINKPAWRPTR